MKIKNGIIKDVNRETKLTKVIDLETLYTYNFNIKDVTASENLNKDKKCVFRLDDNNKVDKIVLTESEYKKKKRLNHILLGLFFGTLGLHNFYSMKIFDGIVKILITAILLMLNQLHSAAGGFLFVVYVLYVIIESIVTNEDANDIKFK